jgi:DNA-binding LytR/AlgR family response regulator
MKEIKILIAEDDVLIAEHLKAILKKNGFVKIEMAHKKKEVIIKIIDFQPDIALLDISMETNQTGVEIAEYISKNFNFPIIFLTALSDKKTIEQALKTSPYGYLIKPFKAVEVITTIQIALKKHFQISEQKYIFIKDGHSDVKIGHNEIYFIKSDKNYLEICTKTKTYIVRQALSEFIEKLDNSSFYRVHKSFIVNINYVIELKSDSLIVGKVEIPISKTYYDEFRSNYLEKSRK